jgi:hypothetical protein
MLKAMLNLRAPAVILLAWMASGLVFQEVGKEVFMTLLAGAKRGCKGHRHEAYYDASCGKTPQRNPDRCFLPQGLLNLPVRYTCRAATSKLRKSAPFSRSAKGPSNSFSL